MPDRRFGELREALLRAGVAAPNVRRAVVEIESHFNELMDEALARGESRERARAGAHALLGADPVLIRRYADQRELQAWSSRWPAIWFTALPLICFLALFLMLPAVFVLFDDRVAAYLHTVRISVQVSDRIDLAVRMIFLWILPIFVAAMFAVLAFRQRIALLWPAVGTVVLCGMVSLINVSVVLSGGASPGEASAGIGISTERLPGQAMHALALAVLTLGPLWLATRRLRRDASTAD
jgi:hypothetical protein